MEMARATWTDTRLDDFATNVDRRFDESDRRLDETREQMASDFQRVDSDLREIRGELAGIRRSILQAGGALFASQMTLTAAIIGMVAVLA